MPKSVTDHPDLLAATLAEAVQDVQTVTPAGKPVQRLCDGVTFREVPTHHDERGSIVEMFDPRWKWHPDPLLFVYSFSIRPGYAKGWGLHKIHEDRYMILQGEMRVVFYDVRPGSPTYGEVSSVILSEHNRRLMNIPRNVWHADYNFGSGDVVVVNFPTIQYDHSAPDKYRLPLHSPLIPYDFGEVRGW